MMVVEKCDTRHCFVSLSFYPFVKSHVEFLISNYSLLIGKFANFPYLCLDIAPILFRGAWREVCNR